MLGRKVKDLGYAYLPFSTHKADSITILAKNINRNLDKL